MGYGRKMEGTVSLRTSKLPLWLRPIWVGFPITCNQKIHVWKHIFGVCVHAYIYLCIYIHRDAYVYMCVIYICACVHLYLPMHVV